VLFWQWRPLDDIVWDIENNAVGTGLYGVYGLGWLIVVASTLLPKRLNRHSLYFGCLMVFWATPTMTAGHLLFAIATTSYILVAIQFEERDVIRTYGNVYRTYKLDTAMLLPIPLPLGEGGAKGRVRV
jgi:protein-S-isoprenylcysteine O-methyltransferase Ste14